MHTSFPHVREGDQQFDASHLSFEPAQGTLKSSEASVTRSHTKYPTQHANNQSVKYPMEFKFVEDTWLTERLWYEGADKCRDQIPKLGLSGPLCLTTDMHDCFPVVRPANKQYHGVEKKFSIYCARASSEVLLSCSIRNNVEEVKPTPLAIPARIIPGSERTSCHIGPDVDELAGIQFSFLDFYVETSSGDA
ncbi:hypothetical protein DFH09DRAFT_1087633 [Mycena vulgaris]|nr:hypothetical protein DFH09DRAFT_1087633 [Mycena vulgaris]